MDQHLVSQFVIKNWAGDDGKVEVFDLRRWDTRREYPRKIMYVASDDTGEGVVPPEFEEEREAEGRDIESGASQALSDDPTTLGLDTERRQAILDLMALHLLRSGEMLGVQSSVIAQGAATVLHEAQRTRNGAASLTKLECRMTRPADQWTPQYAALMTGSC